MQIEVKLLMQFRSYLPNPDLPGTTRSITIGVNARIRDLFSTLEIPLESPKVILLNQRQAAPEDTLKEGDRVTIFPPVGGG